jgi:hypothetical protein
MWEPRRLTILWAFMACNRESFTPTLRSLIYCILFFSIFTAFTLYVLAGMGPRKIQIDHTELRELLPVEERFHTYMEHAPNIEYHCSGETKSSNIVMNH